MQSSNSRFRRRELLQAAGPALLTMGGLSRRVVAGASRKLPPVRTITRGPKHHWFGYYDKMEFDPSGRFVLGMEVDFEDRDPRANDVIKVGMVDLQDGDKWIELGETRAWYWQQGCMLQWRPGSKTEVLWNDRQQGRFVCHILDIETRQRRTLPHAIYTVSPDGRWAVTPDFRRIRDMRPAYGYAGLDDPYRDDLAPEGTGIFRVDLDTGQQELIVSLGDIVKIPIPGVDLSKAKSYFNHLLINPDGSRFIFLHRWGFPKFIGATRMFTASQDGSDLRVVDDSGKTSHFIWRDPESILAWTEPRGKSAAFYLFEDQAGGAVEVVGEDVMIRNGHCSYLPGSEWIINDTYPDDQRKQYVYLYHVPTNRSVPLGRFYAPPEYQRQLRIDTHPRISPDGRKIVIDSAHTGEGRQMHIIDIGEILDG